ncbi:MAG TPA: hypothetical protein VF163_06050, partial [Micromonosporaceae bacterium]
LGAVLAGLTREADRIAYWDMLVQGDVRLVRRRIGGGYFVLLAPRPDAAAGLHHQPEPPVAFRCQDVHLAVGYPGLRFLPELQRFRERYDLHHVVHAYEPHNHVYEALRLRPGTVLVRGAGIAASQVLDRLIRDRATNGSSTRILHLVRTYVEGAHGVHAWSRRYGADGFAYQGFNYPKSVWGGQLRARMHNLDGHERARLYAEIGGTTTAWREPWQRRLREGRQAGWYRSEAGTIQDLRLDQGSVLARIRSAEGVREERVDYVVDSTGLEPDVTEHAVLRDLLERGGARRNPLGRLDVDQEFRLRGVDSGDGRVYVAGAAAYGGPFPGVDTFLGLQIAAQEIVDDLARRGRCRRMGPWRSTVEWLKWAVGRTI